MRRVGSVAAIILLLAYAVPGFAETSGFQEAIFNPGLLKPVDSTVKVVIGQVAPDFSLRSINGGMVSLSQYRGKNKVVLSFVPAAWTPVCSDQWPGYNISRKIFADHNAVLLGITVDNVPTLHAWVQQMGGLWFEVLSDFWPHGRTADVYGVLRTDGMAERALFFIDTSAYLHKLEIVFLSCEPFTSRLRHTKGLAFS